MISIICVSLSDGIVLCPGRNGRHRKNKQKKGDHNDDERNFFVGFAFA
jgi:hypothetical protein